MKLLSKISPSKKVENDAKNPLTHKAWEHANIAQLACDHAQVRISVVLIFGYEFRLEDSKSVSSHRR